MKDLYIRDLPIEIQGLCFKRQAESGNLKNRDVKLSAGIGTGGFTWSRSREGSSFWSEISEGNFDPFYKMYPKTIELPTESHVIWCKGDNWSYLQRFIDYFKSLGYAELYGTDNDNLTRFNGIVFKPIIKEWYLVKSSSACPEFPLEKAKLVLANQSINKGFTMTQKENPFLGYKIGPLNNSQSEIVQETLFKYGFYWVNRIPTPQYSDNEYINACNKSLSFGSTAGLYGAIAVISFEEFQSILNSLNNKTNEKANNGSNEILGQNQKESRGPIVGTARISSGRQQSSTGSRLEGDIQRLSCKKTQVRKLEVRGSVVHA